MNSRQAKPNQVVAILKAREPARILIAIGHKKDDRWHLQLAQRWVMQYNFYINDKSWGPMFVQHVPLPAVLGARLSDPAPLPGTAHARRRH